MYQTVMDKIGKPIVFNICMLGSVISFDETNYLRNSILEWN